MEPDGDVSRLSIRGTSGAVNEKSRRFACVRCRQSKIRCDNDQTGRACRRCAASGYVCDYIAEYKRVSKKRKIQELVNEVQHLRATVGATGQPVPSSSRASALSPDTVRVDSVQQHYSSPSHSPQDAVRPFTPPSNAPPLSSGPPGGGHEQGSAPLDRTIGNVAVLGADSTHLLARFFDRFHPFIELLDEASSPDSIYAQSPLLFWAIIAVASCHDGLNSTLQRSLSPAVTDLLWRTFAHPPYSVSDIQGMLLLCLWPFPAPSMSSDFRFPLVAATRSAAMQVGLHCLDNMRDFSHLKTKMSEAERLRAAKTWAACVVAVESITGFVGQPSIVRDEVTSDTILAIAPEHGLPTQLDSLFQIFIFSNRVHRLMTSVSKETADLVRGERTVILTVLEREYHHLWTNLADQISAKAMVILAFAGLQMRVYYFFDRCKSPRRRLGIVRAYQLTLLLAEQLREVDGSSGLLRYAPVVYQDAMIFASIFLLKVMKSSYAEDVDAEAGDAALDVCLTKLRECVATTGDFRAKVYKMIAQLRTMDHASRTSGDREPHLKLRTRLSGSLVHDFLWLWREEFGGQRSARNSPARQVKASTASNDATRSTHNAEEALSRVDRHSEDASRQFQQPMDYHSQSAPTFEYSVPQYTALNSSEGVESSGDLLFAELFGGGGLGPSSLIHQRADVDWFYQADSLAL